MKKTVVLILALIFCICNAYAETEITFQNIPWLSNEITTRQMLEKAGFYHDGVEYPRFNQGLMRTILVNDTGFVFPDYILGVEDVTTSILLEKSAQGKVGGYPVKSLELNFAYDGEYKLISIIVELINCKFNDLKAKITKVYGEGEHRVNDEGIESNVWKGANNTCVILYTQNEGLNYTFMYGRIDSEEIIMNCLVPDKDVLSGL